MAAKKNEVVKKETGRTEISRIEDNSVIPFKAVLSTPKESKISYQTEGVIDTYDSTYENA
jgi:hypothetical protein